MSAASVSIARAPVALALLVSVMVLTGCISSGGGGAGEPLDLTILHVNDHHSHLDAESTTLTLNNAAGAATRVGLPLGGFARVAAVIAELSTASSNVIKLHAGDAMTGDLYFTQSEGEADAVMMNTVCFDAFAIGNHEFDNRDAGLVKFIDFLHAAPGPCRTPVLSANVNAAAGSALSGRIEPYTIVERSGQKIGVVGLTVAGKTRNASRPDASTVFAEELLSAQGAIDSLGREGVNKIVLLSHQGYAVDVAMASQLSGVDVIVGGDSHTLLGPDSLKAYGLSPGGNYPTEARDSDGRRVCVAQAWQYSYAVGELKVSFDRDGVVSSCGGRPHILVGDAFSEGGAAPSAADVAAYRTQLDESGAFSVIAPLPAAVTALEPYKLAKDALGLEVAGSSADDLCLRRVPGSKRDSSRSRLGDACNLDPHVTAHGGDIQQRVAEAFLHQGQRFGGADIALQNAGGVRVDIAAGAVTVGKVYELLPFKNLLVRLTLSGDEVVSTLEDAVESVINGTGTGAYPYTAGLRFNVDMNQTRGSRISAMEWRDASGSWVAFDRARNYRLITNNFTAEGGDSYDTLKRVDAARREDTFLDYADAFLQYVKDNSPLSRPDTTAFSTKLYIETP